MARPSKKGLDHFPLDVGFFEDERILAISGEFAMKGEMIALRLLCEIYQKGYFVRYSETLTNKLARSGLSRGLVDEVIIKLVKYEFFDGFLFREQNILTSESIQKRYFEAIKRRVKTTDEYPYLLLKKVYVCRNPSKRSLCMQKPLEKEFMYAETPKKKSLCMQKPLEKEFMYAETPKKKSLCMQKPLEKEFMYAETPKKKSLCMQKPLEKEFMYAETPKKKSLCMQKPLEKEFMYAETPKKKSLCMQKPLEKEFMYAETPKKKSLCMQKPLEKEFMYAETPKKKSLCMQKPLEKEFMYAETPKKKSLCMQKPLEKEFMYAETPKKKSLCMQKLAETRPGPHARARGGSLVPRDLVTRNLGKKNIPRILQKNMCSKKEKEEKEEKKDCQGKKEEKEEKEKNGKIFENVLFDINAYNEKKERKAGFPVTSEKKKEKKLAPQKETKHAKGFLKPSTDDLTDFFKKKVHEYRKDDLNALESFNERIEAQKFFNFYNSKDWFVGKNKMKRWKSAAANWFLRIIEKNQKQKKPRSTYQNYENIGNIDIYKF